MTKASRPGTPSGFSVRLWVTASFGDKAVNAVDAATDTVKAADKTKDAVKNADNVTPPSTPKPKPPPKPAPPAKPKPAPPTKNAIYKAPYKGKTKKIEEEGFKPEDYPGRKGQNPDGHAYFGLGDKGLVVAEDYAGRGPYGVMDEL
ncbi:hypothetical protein JCM4814A_17230 [Streptomyces phaeofaciens JCM 4814]|uniref:Uncharacterized protein n=1 Tax=Streptomyces phaeofaciens TaxID=68254 RepID=A0A918HA82_9ACTN|nr:hypothetical protein GCM10010226_28010 [Streptomyces phaeofaciens]